MTGVIVALGGKTADVGETMLTDGTACVIEAMKKTDVKRVAVVTSIGAGDSENQAPFFFKVTMLMVGSEDGRAGKYGDMLRWGHGDFSDHFR